MLKIKLDQTNLILCLALLKTRSKIDKVNRPNQILKIKMNLKGLGNSKPQKAHPARAQVLDIIVDSSTREAISCGSSNLFLV